MREFDSIGIRLCDEQAELFQASLRVAWLGSPVFIRRFVYSDVAKEFDNLSAMNAPFEASEALERINAPFGKTSRKGKRYSAETLYWMGYLYRYWCYVHEIDSIRLYKDVPPSELAKRFEIYHTLDPEKAVSMIQEDLGLGQANSLAYGVAIYRGILKNFKR
ncbi:MAG: hypothetical protein IJU64_01240 [Bacilli bacterium]|nr:hypothetical protein [Bacilli bacterium]